MIQPALICFAAAVSSSGWDAGWVYRGMGQYGHSVSQMDSYIIALGRTLDPVAISPVIAKAALLDGSSSFSHIRAVCLALEKPDRCFVNIRTLLSAAGC